MMQLAPVPAVATVARAAAALQGRRQAATEALAAAELACQALADEAEDLEKLAALFRGLMDAEISSSAEMIEKLQTEGLQAVFDDMALSVEAAVSVKRGKVSVDLTTKQQHPKGVVGGGVLESFGGSVAAVQSVLMRVILVFRRGLRPIILLDESLPAFDNNYIGNMAVFLRKLCKEMGITLLLVTHNPALVEAADISYLIERKAGRATFERVR